MAVIVKIVTYQYRIVCISVEVINNNVKKRSVLQKCETMAKLLKFYVLAYRH